MFENLQDIHKMARYHVRRVTQKEQVVGKNEWFVYLNTS